MTPSDARALLGVSPQATHDEVRAAFRAQIGRHHPDVNPAPGTSARAMALIEAWEVLSVEPAVTDPPVTDPPITDPPITGPLAAWATGSSVMAAAPADEVMLWLIDAAHRVGDVTFLDMAAGLVEALVEFVDGPVVTLTLSLQGRVAAGTEVFISMEPWSRPPRPDLPDPDAVARLLAHHLCEAAAELGPPLTD
ncbi:MAG: J domain-containing protein [Candidatus Microthrix sp.]|nr:DnaJ domain-containing protein [Candidatus Microthrix sp.]MBK7324168.1 J domain-containing protein [Candidatus Microthrix sp.]